jgi:hypothetical protein
MSDIRDGGSRYHLGNSFRGRVEVGVVVLERVAELLRPSWYDEEIRDKDRDTRR